MSQRQYVTQTFLPGSVPGSDKVIAHTEDALIAVKNVQVYPDGLTFDLWMFCSDAVRSDERGIFASPNGVPADGGLGVEVFERAGSIEVSRGASIQGGGGSSTRKVVGIFAPLEFVSGAQTAARIRITWPELGIDENYELPGDEILRAREHAIEFTSR